MYTDGVQMYTNGVDVYIMCTDANDSRNVYHLVLPFSLDGFGAFRDAGACPGMR